MSNWQDKRIGRYQITQLLGQSNSCSVWLATDTENQQKLAIRMLPAVPASNRAYLNDVAALVRSVAALEHPHILAVQDSGELEVDNGEVAPYLVMPYIAGGTLAERMRSLDGMLPVYESLRYLRQAARALDYAHHRHMLHRDVRPENMFLRKGWLQLADFGVAKIMSRASYYGRAHSESRTPEYMAPELIGGKEEAASDRYSLAVIAYQLFTGHFPFQGKTTHETLARQVKEQPPEPRQFNTYIPLEVVQILMRGLAKRPENRPATCAEFLDALEFGWKASGKSEEGPDTTWLAPWSKHWSEGEEADEIGYSGELPAQRPNAQQKIDIQPQELHNASQPAAHSDQQPPATRTGRKDNLTPFPRIPTGFGEQPPAARTGRKDNLTPFPRIPTGFGEQSLAPPKPDDQAAEFPELPSWLPEPFRKAAASKPAARSTPPAAAASADQVAGFPELPSWLPEPFRKTLTGKPAQPSQPAAAAVRSDQVVGFPELPSWLPQAFKGGAPAAKDKSTPFPQPTQAARTEPAAEFPELPSWLPQSYRATPSNQAAQVSSGDRNDQAVSQPLSPLPQMAQQPSFGYHEATQRPNTANNVIQKPLSFDSVVRNAIEAQSTGEMPVVAQKPATVQEPAIVQKPALAKPGRVKHYESFSGVVKEAIAAQQHMATPLVVSLHEPLVSRDNSAKFEAVVKQAMGVEPQGAAAASRETPLPTTSLQETRFQRWEKRVRQWQKQLRAWLQRTFAQSKQRLQQAYVWSRPRLLRAYIASKQWLLHIYVWILQLVNKYGPRNKR